MVRLISGHQEIVNLLVVYFKVAHLYMTFDLKYNYSNDEDGWSFFMEKMCGLYIFQVKEEKK